jgi:ABC-type Fe3+ transport system substrate-binding protein
MPIMDHAAHPNAARVLINWFYSKEGQETYHVHSTRPNPKPSLRTDITEWGKTVPGERVQPGKDVVVMTEVPGFDLLKGLRIAEDIYKKYNR